MCCLCVGNDYIRSPLAAVTSTASAPGNAAAWARRNGCPATPVSSKLYTAANPGLTTEYKFNTIEAFLTNAQGGGTYAFEFPLGLTQQTFNADTTLAQYPYNRLPFAPASDLYTDKEQVCASVELVSHYDVHTWPKKTTSVGDDIAYHGNGLFDTAEYMLAFFQKYVKQA